ncbi:hypothetical protein GA0116948_11081 [Chitinophaga costaii]|uniref:Uncharacterized protein n=1 Tax=Chitinophaga costaii TaxID=1335309 RepID=A0A1C4EX71_9BACT|nr:hypothetical protein GA0116948_11081 [Chitinophaga costaii]
MHPLLQLCRNCTCEYLHEAINETLRQVRKPLISCEAYLQTSHETLVQIALYCPATPSFR